jgi:parallel beta-helix repeat protein
MSRHAPSRPPERHVNARTVPCLEQLEDRCLPATLFVDPNVAATAQIFPTIAAAVNAAHANDTIKVVAGTYHDSVDITKPGLTLLGNQVRVAGEPTGPSIITPNAGIFAFTLDASNITIKGFTIKYTGTGVVTHAPGSGINILNNLFVDDVIGVDLSTSLAASAATSTITGNKFTFDQETSNVKESVAIDKMGARNVVISKNTFAAAELDFSVLVDCANVSTNIQILNNVFDGEAAIAVDNLSGGKIDNNTIRNSLADAIALHGGVTGTEIANNTIVYTKTTPAPQDGIVLDNELVASLESGNKILGNTIRGMSVGILLSPASQNTVSGNNLAFSLTDGISIQGGSSGNTILANVATLNKSSGIFISASNNNTLTRNVFNHNQQHGIVLSGSAGTTVTRNTTSFNGLEGIELFGGSNNNTLANNTSSFNPAGIDIESSLSNTLTGNLAEGNAQAGFELLNTSRLNTLSNNTARGNLQDGFLATLSSNSNIYDHNLAAGNLLNGFDIAGVAGQNEELLSNTASRNRLDGFTVLNGSDSLIKANTATDNLGNGFLLQTLSTAFITANTSTGNDARGMLLAGVTDSIVSANTIHDNGADGLVASTSSTGNEITGNTAIDNGILGGGFDVLDGSGTAANNSWSNNTANTANPPSLLSGLVRAPRLAGTATIHLAAQGPSALVLNGTASPLGHYTGVGEINLASNANGWLDGAGVVVLKAANGDQLVGRVSCQLDPHGGGHIAFSWRDSVPLDDESQASTGRFATVRPPSVVGNVKFHEDEDGIIAILIGL